VRALGEEAPDGVPFRGLRRGGNGNGPAVADADDGAAVGEEGEGVAEAFVSDAKLVT
jgi:hypothetical protein